MPTLLPPFEIHQPQTLREASEMLEHFGEEGCIYAGGTELLLAMKQGGLRYGHLVDIKTIPGLKDVHRQNGLLHIGALASHLALERSPLVAEALPVFTRLERHVANIRVRATGTIGGNLCFGEPHSDPATLLLCLEARVQLAGPDGDREVALQDFLVGPFEVDLRPGEVLESITVPVLSTAQRAAYHKFQVHEYPMLGLGLVLDLADPQTITRASVAVGSVSPTPRRSPAAEQLLIGPVTEVMHSIDDAADALADTADLLDDLEGSAEYKRHLIHVFLKRAFEEATASAS